MKKILIIFVTLFFFSCSVQKLSKTGKQEIDFVSSFIKHMVDGTSGDSQTMRNYISPNYLKENKLDIKVYTVNTYYPDDFKIETYDQKKGVVYATIWGSDKAWIHRLKFKVEKIDNNLYLYGSKYSDTFIDPWSNVEAYITE